VFPAPGGVKAGRGGRHLSDFRTGIYILKAGRDPDGRASIPPYREEAMKKLTLDLESLGVETFSPAPELAPERAEFFDQAISRRSCIEQCTTSCVP
jgi:hypothetical protein